MSTQPDLESAIKKIGQEIFSQMRGRAPALLSRGGFYGRVMEWTMRDEAFKVQMFRFVDALPSLPGSQALTDAMRQYLARGPRHLGAPLNWGWGLGLRAAGLAPWLVAPVVRRGVEGMARQFIAGSNPPEAAEALERLHRNGSGFTVDLLGEAVVSEPEADAYAAQALALLEYLAEATRGWGWDGGEDVEWPTVNLSVKISALSSKINAADPEGSLAELKRRLRPILRRAAELEAFVNFDMESYVLKELTFRLFREVFSESEFAKKPRAGLALQAYLVDSGDDLAAITTWARERGRRVGVRLVKGAYWDSEVIIARQKGWPVPVFTRKAETDAQYERLTRFMLENNAVLQSAFGTHNVRSIAHAIAAAEAMGVSPRGYEFQMLHGMAGPIEAALLQRGCRVREYCPVGDLIPGMAYLVRRLIENTSNEGFLRSNFVEGHSARELLRNPVELVAAAGKEQEESHPATFANLAPLDFTVESNRRQLREAIGTVRGLLGREYPLRIDGQAVATAEKIVSVNPSRPTEIIGRVSKASRAEAERAVQAARRAQTEWGRKPAEERAAIIERVGRLLREQRFEFCALEILEAGKTWSEADIDVNEAIDFCFYYGREMRRLGRPRITEPTPGEESHQEWIARGVGLIVAPWNFPLAILCGMTVAALVTGNAVVLKPAEPTVVIGAWLAEVLAEAGVPNGVFNFCPGPGREIGDFLVGHAEVDFIAFTGSKEVGLHLCELAGRTAPGQRNVKKVICEMGGKNAVIIDSDADLDEAVPGILASAFGYQGQKCSALSRLVVVEDCYDRLMERLVAAAGTLTIGSAEDPASRVGPVITAEARDRLLEYIEIGRQEATLMFQSEVPGSLRDGYFVPPTIFADVMPEARIAQEEIFGPVLSVLRARDFDHALELANRSEFALTAGIYTRNPAHLEAAAKQLVAGNVYINRTCTGAVVGRHPFGGFRMSGVGTKAGGPDYLLHFMFPRVVTENTMRRGFAPNS